MADDASRFDAIVIGAGQAGSPMALRLAAEGRSVALIERDAVGGTCVNTGCTPTKTLVASAAIAQAVRRAAEYGVTVAGPVGIDMARVKARVDAVVADKRDGLRQAIASATTCELIAGQARFTATHEVAVGGRRLRADQIFLDVGSRPVVPSLPGLDDVPYLTSTTILQLDAVPAHLVILGGSYIALEFAQIHRRFGSAVTVIERGPRLVPREDGDISAAVQEILEGEGIVVRLGASVIGVERRDDGIVVRLDNPGGDVVEIAGSHLLLATGRRPNTDDLGLDAAGIARDPHGFIVVDDALATSQPGIWAMGDCNGRGAFTHTAYNDYEIVAANLLDGGARRVSDRISCYALYIEPALGRAGMTLAEAKASGRRVLVGERPMTRVARAVEKGDTRGFMRVIVDADSSEILGAAILGPAGDEVVHAVLDLMYARAPYTVLQHAMHIHPTVSELLPTIMAGSVSSRASGGSGGRLGG